MGNLAYQNETERDKAWNEMLDGRLVAMSPRPVVNHDVAAENIKTIFKIFLKGKTCRAFGELDVYLTKKDRVIPDAIIVCNRDIIKKTGIYGPPDLIVEVLSPGTAKRDRGYKKTLYEKCGVREYWLVNTDSQSIEVHILADGMYELDNVYTVFPDYLLEVMTEEEKAEIIHEFKTSIFDDLIIKLEDVFDGLF